MRTFLQIVRYIGITIGVVGIGWFVFCGVVGFGAMIQGIAGADQCLFASFFGLFLLIPAVGIYSAGEDYSEF